MGFNLSLALFFCLLFTTNGCDSKTSVETPPSTTTPAVATATTPSGTTTAVPPEASPDKNAAVIPAKDACTLIEKSEIASVQGDQVQSIVPSKQVSGGLAISQCYYTVISGSKNLSVHLEVMERDASSSDKGAIREFWQERFHKDKEEREDDKESGPPLEVSGVGDEAFWMGNSKVGALYALRKDKIVRISVGGPGNSSEKIARSKTLAQKAFARIE